MGHEIADSSFIVNIRPEPGGAGIAANSMDLHIDLRGTIELLHGDAYLALGQFEDAIFLFPDLANIADRVARLRDGAPAVEVALLESPELVLTRRRRQPGILDLRYGREALHAISVEQFDAAFAEATRGFFYVAAIIKTLQGDRRSDDDRG